VKNSFQEEKFYFQDLYLHATFLIKLLLKLKEFIAVSYNFTFIYKKDYFRGNVEFCRDNISRK